MTLKTRLGKLELASADTAPKSDFERRLEAEWTLYALPLAATMAEPHLEVLLKTLETDTNDPAALALYRFFFSVLSGHWTQGRPLTLPYPVAEAVLRYHAQTSAFDCENCAYHVPTTHKLNQDPRAYAPVGTSCLLCGGRVGYFAYWQKHNCYPGETCDPLLGSREQQERRKVRV